MYKLIVIIFLSWVGLNWAASYYVDKDHPNANDNNPGTEALPWKSIEKAVNTALAGDTAFFKKATSDYLVNTNISFPNSGSPGNHIVFKAFNSNEKPVWNWSGYNFRIIDKHYITIDGFVITGVNELYTGSGSSNIHILNNHIIGGGPGSGELVRFEGPDNLVSHNEIENAGHNAVYLTSYSPEGNTSSGTIIEYNYIHDNSDHHAINIFPVVFDDNPLHIDNIIIRYNRIESSDWGIYTRYMRAFKIYNNIIYNNRYGGIHLGGFDSDNGGAQNRNDPYDGLGAIVANNIIITGLSNDITGFENERVNNMRFVNNIVSAGFPDAVRYRSKDNGAHPTLNQTIDNNIYDGGNVRWGSLTYGSPSEWFSGVPEHNNHSYDTDPLYITTGYDQRWNVPSTFALQSVSPAIDAGYNLIQFGIFDDYINVSRPQGSAFDIGAYEIISGPDIYPPEVIGATTLDSVTLKLYFSEPLESSTAQNPNNYSITNGISIFSASLSGSEVILNTSPHTPGNYTVTVSNVTDLAGNIISPSANSAQYEFVQDPQNELTQLQIVNVTASVTPEPDHSPEKTIDGLGYGDGDLDSRWAGDTMPEWLTFDLGIVYEVSLSKLSFFNWNSGRIYNYTISVSTDMNQWTEVVSNASSSSEEWTINEFQPTNARYVRVNFINSNQGTWAGLWEGELWGNVSTSVDIEETIPDGFKLEQNYPNPFNPSTKIRFTISELQFTILKVYDVLGNEVTTLVNEEKSPGTYEAEFNAENLSSGIYFYHLTAGNFSGNMKMMLLK